MNVVIPFVVGRLGDEDTGVRASAISALQTLAKYSEPSPYITLTLADVGLKVPFMMY